MASDFDGKKCEHCGGESFRLATDDWMSRTFRFVEKGQLKCAMAVVQNIWCVVSVDRSLLGFIPL